MPRRYTDLQLACAVAESKRISEVLGKLGLVPRGGNYTIIKRRIEELDLNTDHFVRQPRARSSRATLADVPDEQFASVVANSWSIAAILRDLQLAPSGGAYSAIRSRIDATSLDTSHFLGQAWRRGSRAPSRPGAPLSELLVRGRPYSSNKLRKRLIREGVKEARCEMCGLAEWQGGPICLELDHINGRSDDNRLENLRIVCPNCHATTETFRGRNIGVAK